MCPKVLPYLMASRSKHADLDGVITPEMEAIYALPRGKHVLRSFAPMGSAVCFPVESVIFWALAVSSIWNSENTLDCEGRRLIEESVYVFGDDIIIPTKYAQQVMDDLTLFGLKFGPEKCFTKGPFRESCGCNAFDGERIEPVMIKKALPLALEDVERLAAWLITTGSLLTDGCGKHAHGLSSRLFLCLGRTLFHSVMLRTHPFCICLVSPRIARCY